MIKSFVKWYYNQKDDAQSFLNYRWRLHLVRNPRDNKPLHRYMFARTLFRKMILVLS